MITRRFRSALRIAAASIGQIAHEAGYSRVTFDTYLNRRTPTRRAALALAGALERRANELNGHARRLREAVDDGGAAV